MLDYALQMKDITLGSGNLLWAFHGIDFMNGLLLIHRKAKWRFTSALVGIGSLSGQIHQLDQILPLYLTLPCLVHHQVDDVYWGWNNEVHVFDPNHASWTEPQTNVCPPYYNAVSV